MKPPGENSPSEEPTPEEQTQYWELVREIGVCRAGEDTEGEATAWARLKLFLEEHADKRFRVFDPEDVALAVDPDLEPLDLNSGREQDAQQTSMGDAYLQIGDIADEWIGQPVYAIFRDERSGQPIRHIALRWLEGVSNEGVWLDKGHYVEATAKFTRTGQRELHPWASLWHIHYDPLIADAYT